MTTIHMRTEGERIKSISVFCGSRVGGRPVYQAAAAEFGVILAQRKVRLVYGGGSVGLMGALSSAALSAGGDVVGVIPQSLIQKEHPPRGLSQLHVVSSMGERKSKMCELSDAFVALAGGFGTHQSLHDEELRLGGPGSTSRLCFCMRMSYRLSLSACPSPKPRPADHRLIFQL